MKSDNKQLKKKYLLLIILLFLLSRIFVLTHPPYVASNEALGIESRGYSDVKHDYERYANMWKYGLTPYLKHLYEYPPATIPLVYLPLEVDLSGFGYYYLNYRVQIFLFEVILFGVILYTIGQLNVSTLQKYLSILFYICAGLLARDYWYEGLDLFFMGTLVLAIAWKFHRGSKTWVNRVFFWALFWLSVGIKYLTAPLVVPFMLFARKDLKSEFVSLLGGFLIIWLLPMMLFRSSLSVMVIFHLNRPLKYGSFGTFIVNLINDFTQTEHQSDIAPHFPIIGPVSEIVEKAVGILFPLAIFLVVIAISAYVISRSQATLMNRLFVYRNMIKMTLAYILVVFLTSKVFSSPFHIWYVPLIALYPFKDIRKQLLFILLAFWMLLLDTTPIIRGSEIVLLGPITLARVRDFTRFLPMMIFLWMIFNIDKVDKNRAT